MQNKSHNDVNKPRAFSKGRIRGELTITPIRGMLTKRRYELIFGHSSQTITTGLVRMLYPWDTEHLGYNMVSLPSGNTANTSVHLIQLSSECIKASIHALKLRHDRIKSHTSRKRKGSEGEWS